VSTPQTENDLNWLCQDFIRRTPGAAHAVVTSSDGVQIASSEALPATRAVQVCAVASGLVSLTYGLARCFDAGAVEKLIVQMDHGFLFLMAISDGSSLTVLAAPDCDTARVGHEMGAFVERVGRVLTPELREANTTPPASTS
jgi:predicted regulator of Ras-like GTPase activity (Roadblock/LC7/MglB family)